MMKTQVNRNVGMLGCNVNNSHYNKCGVRDRGENRRRRCVALATSSAPLLLKQSRVGKQPVPVPKEVSLTLEKIDSGKKQVISAKGKLGELCQTFTDQVVFDMDNEGIVQVNRANDSKLARQQHGLARSLLNNMVVGVSKGFEKKLIMIGVGYKGEVQKDRLIMNLGYVVTVRTEDIQCSFDTMRH